MSRSARRPFALLTNLWWGGLSGTEAVTRQYAEGLTRRGWRVAIYAPNPKPDGPRLADVEVVASLAALEQAPDIIHGHQHPALAPALLRFRSSPAIQMAHDGLGWHDAALAWQRVRARAAVDEACRERAAAETGLAPAEIALLPNAVELDRCRLRPSLPSRPARVLIVANRNATHVAAVEAACAAAGLETRKLGHGVARPSASLESEMAEADIVVGAARIALEAMAVGCAALVCDYRGLAGLARPETVDDWRAWNFGYRLLTAPVTAETVGAALAAYDAEAAMEVSRRVRAACGLEPALDRLEQLYRNAMARHEADPVDREREIRDTAAYLQAWLPSSLEFSPFAPDMERFWLAEAQLQAAIAEFARRGFTVEFRSGPAPVAPAT